MQPSSPTDLAVRAKADPEPVPPALELIDDIQGVRVQLSTAHACQPTRCSTDDFLFPVDIAYDLSPTKLWTHQRNTIIVRDTEGDVHAEITNQGTTTVPSDTYLIELCSLGLKVYFVVRGAISIQTDSDRGQMIDCEAADMIQIGLRSFHESPAATVTTTDHPRDIMRAFSCLGSALKTTSCERSFPTLRGHPPLLERGEYFHAPPDLERTADTASVRIEVPLSLEALYPIAPLAYYLNAVVQPGTFPRLVTDGTAYDLDNGEGIETGVARYLTHLFTLDCITRTEGFYPIQLGERTTLEQRLSDAGRDDIDFTALYEQSLAEQVQTYHSIPFEMVEDLVPRWPLTADVLPVAKYLPYLPFVVANLGMIRCLPTSPQQPTTTVSPAVEAFCRNARVSTAQTSHTRDGSTASDAQQHPPTRAPDDQPGIPTDIHHPPKTDSITQLWLTDGYPIQGAKPILAACQRRLDANPIDTIDIAVINNDPAMQAESAVVDLYGLRDRIVFDVTINEEISQSELCNVLAADHDLVHYVGHVDGQGLQCSDGWLDAHTLDRVGARAFVLNGCRSYEQGMALVEAGAIGGLCTLTNVSDTVATRIGRTVARLFNAGFSLGGARDIISENSLTGQQYMIVGDPNLAIVQSQEATPTLAEIAPQDDNTFTLSIYGYPSSRAPIGMPHVPSVDGNSIYYLNSGHLTTFTVSRTALAEYLQRKRFPVRIDGSLTWSDMVTPDTIAHERS